jgi:hypothetical protein
MREGPPPPGTDGYPSGTDGYPSGTDGYPSDPATPSVRSSLGPAEEAEGERKPYWAGFESPEAYFDHIVAERAKVQRYLEPPPRRRQIPTRTSRAETRSLAREGLRGGKRPFGRWG